MNRLNIRELIFNFIFLLLIQLPLIYRVTLFNKAFGFFYVGFILLLPTKLSRSYLMLAGFFSGLLVDIFTNTPGMHAMTCVFIMFIRNFWLKIINNDTEEFANINVITLGKIGFISYTYPLILIHHLVLFTLENGGLQHFGTLITKIFFSSLLSFAVVFAVNYLVKSNSEKA